MTTALVAPTQLPLIHCIESDDTYLERRPDVLWHDLLRHMDWRDHVSVAAQYYEALWQFNQEQARARAKRRVESAKANPETQEQATLRLLFDRATMREGVPVLEESSYEEIPPVHVNPATVRPGSIPVRLAGRSPKCFFAMFKAFVGIAVKGRAPEPDYVYEELRDNPSFARACGFTLPDPDVGYRQSDSPGLRKIEQFDQIMTSRGLWDRAAYEQVAKNLKAEVVKVGTTLVHDTTHYRARSGMQVVEVPEEKSNEQAKGSEAREDAGSQEKEEKPVGRKNAKNRNAKRRSRAKERKKKKRKSQSRTTKNCRCENRTTCSHEWVSADSGAGTVVKTGRKMHWAHKASTLAFAGQENVLLDAVAMTDAASHDSQSLVPHLERLFERHPDLWEGVHRVLDDSAADDTKLKEKIAKEFEMELLTSPNPRGRKPITKDLPRGLDHLTNVGVPVCRAGFPFDFVGCRHEEERFLFRASDLEEGTPVCEGCPLKQECCRPGTERRHVSIPFERLPWIDPEFPQLSITFQKEMAKRTVVERIHKLMKDDYGDERLTKRGNKAFQARLDKTKLAMHLVLAHNADSS